MLLCGGSGSSVPSLCPPDLQSPSPHKRQALQVCPLLHTLFTEQSSHAARNTSYFTNLQPPPRLSLAQALMTLPEWLFEQPCLMSLGSPPPNAASGTGWKWLLTMIFLRLSCHQANGSPTQGTLVRMDFQGCLRSPKGQKQAELSGSGSRASSTGYLYLQCVFLLEEFLQ